MRWADQLIKLSNFELEMLQTRLAEVVGRREAAQVKLAVLVAQGEAEIALARTDPEMAWNVGAFTEALKLKKRAAQTDIDTVAAEEEGVRDAISEAFESLKKYEQVAENARLADVRKEARIETAAYDEMGLRRAVGRR
jgi:flagellar FliJ protein